MFFLEILPFIRNYLNFLQQALAEDNTNYRLSKIQRIWLGFCLMGILLTNSVAWAKFERATFGLYTKHAFSAMFRRSKISWDRLLANSGVEFSGTTRNMEHNHFRASVKNVGAEHCYIPPGHCNANADVESIHATIEEEFYNLTDFESREDFLMKAESYRLFYNLQRPNFSKGAKTPWLIAQEDHSQTDQQFPLKKDLTY